MDLTHKILSDYSYYLRIERALSPNTVEAYTSDMESFFSQVAVEPAHVSTQDILDYLAANERLSKRSQSRLLSSFRSFFDWLVMEGDRKDNPCDPIDSPKLGRYLPEVLSVEEVTSIINSVDISKWNGKRDRAVLEILYGCGLRVSEAVGLKISNVYLEEGFVRVVGKGDKERIVPMGEMAAEAVKEYMAARPEPAPGLRRGGLWPLPGKIRGQGHHHRPLGNGGRDGENALPLVPGWLPQGGHGRL